MPDDTLSTLEQIRVKVRRLTRSPSSSQLTDSDIDDYVNTFVLYDFPEELRLKTLRTIFSFYTDPYIDTYENNTTDVDDQLYNFKNKYVTVHEPIYVAGNRASFSEDREEFYGIYPKVVNEVVEGTGDAATTNFTGTLDNVPVVRNEVLFNSVDTAGDPLKVYDDGDGNLEGDVGAASTINYVTGAYDVTFSVAPDTDESVYSQTVPYSASRPIIVLFYENKFVVRPIPDKVYKIELEAYIRPTELLAAANQPDLSQWWQYISYGAAIKIFQDRSDNQAVSELMPEFKRQERLALRKTIVQMSNERTATIYSGPGNVYGDNLETNN